MGIGKEAAEQLKEETVAQQQQFQAASDRAALTAQNKEANWSALVTALQRDVAEFVENFPPAQTQYLQADLLNSNNLTIATRVQPLLKIEVLRDYQRSGVVVITMRQKRGYEDTVGETPTFGYVPEGFTDGSRVYTPEQFASEILEDVTEFFRPDTN